MAYTAQQLQALIDLRASGKLRISVGDRTVQYQTGADLDAAIAQARRDVAAAQAAAAGTQRCRRHFMEFSRGD